MPDIGLLQGPVRPRVPPAAPSLVAAPGPAPADVIAEPAMLKVAARSAPAEFAILRAPVEPESVIEVALAPVVSSTSEPAVVRTKPARVMMPWGVPAPRDGSVTSYAVFAWNVTPCGDVQVESK